MSECGENTTMAVQQPYTLFVPVSPGLESLLLHEVRGIGGIRPKQLAGGVEFEANDHVLYRALLELGLGTDIRVRMGKGLARYPDAIVRQTAQMPWNRWIGAGQSVEIRASARKSRMMHTGAIEERVRLGIREVVGSFASDHPEPWRVYARVEHDQLELSLSMAGSPLHRRGYRQEVGKAPLREDLARALLYLTGWEPDTPLVDTFCGSGTIVIEAARMRMGIPPGWNREFHIQRAPTFDEDRWQAIRNKHSEVIKETSSGPKIMGSDRDSGVIRAAVANAERAGVSELIDFVAEPLTKAPFLRMEFERPGLWLSNPPYGDRVRGGADLRSLYQTIGRLKQTLNGWRLGLLVDDAGLARSTGIDLSSLALLSHGGKKVRVFGELEAVLI